MRKIFLIFVLFLSIGFRAECAAIVADNDDGAPVFQKSGSWSTSSIAGYNGGTYLTTQKTSPASYAIWTPSLPSSGDYEVYAIFRNGTNRTTDAPFTVVHADGTSVVHVDMTGSGSVVEIPLGKFKFNAGSSGYVRLDNNGGSGYYIADAVKFQIFGGEPPVITMQPHSPLWVMSSDTPTVKAKITDDVGVTTVTLTYVTTIENLVTTHTLPVYSSSSVKDVDTTNSLYWTSVPAQPNNAFVSYFFNAQDANSNNVRGQSKSYMVGVTKPNPDSIFILAGQSNASGRGEIDVNTETATPYIFSFKNDYTWDIAAEPMDDPTNQVDAVSDDTGYSIPGVKGHTFTLKAAKDIFAMRNAPMAIIPCPKGGTSVSQWRRPIDPFDRTTLFGSMNYRRLQAAPDGVAGIWWYQGEADANNVNYVARNASLIGEFRAEIREDLPVVYVQIARNLDPAANPGYFRIAELQRQQETGSGYSVELSGYYMVVAFDQGNFDNAHIDQAGQKEVGRRVALATLEHIYGYPVDGTGPRLVKTDPLIFAHGNKSIIQIRIDKPVNIALNNYDNQFKVYDEGVEVPIASVVRDPADNKAVLISLSSPIVGTATVTYGENYPTAAHTPLPNVIKGANALPLPRFGPLTVSNPQASVSYWYLH